MSGTNWIPILTLTGRKFKIYRYPIQMSNTYHVHRGNFKIVRSSCLLNDNVSPASIFKEYADYQVVL